MKRILFACLILCLFVGISPAIAQTIRTIAFSGDPAPGLPGLTYDGFGGMHLSNRGEVFFNAGLQGPGIQNHTNTGMWKSTSGGIELIAREFDLAPGLYQGVPGMPFTGVHFDDFKIDPSYPEVATAGDFTVFRSRLIGRNQNNVMVGSGAWFITSSGLELISATAETLPGLPSDTLVRSIYNLSINAQGKVIFGPQLQRNGNIFYPEISGFWTDVNGSLEHIAAGEQLGGMYPGVSFSAHSSTEFSLNDGGQLVFTAGLQGPGITSENNIALLKGTVGNFSQIVREGDPAPGVLSGAAFATFVEPTLDADGRVLFQGRLAGAGIDDTNDWGIWLEDSGSIDLVAREGDQAPGVPSGVAFANLDPSYPNLFTPKYGKSGLMAINAKLVGTGIDSSNDVGVWWGTPDDLQLVAREGGTLPGVPVGEYIRSVGGSLNESGRLMLSGSLSSRTFVDSALYDQAIWAQDRFGDLQMIVKTGDLLEVTPGVFQPARYLEFGGFNDRGQVLFKASFQTDLPFQPTIYQSGLFVSSLVAVPEPSALVFSACLAMLAAIRRRN
jgi:hypothetical protein